MNPTFIRLTKQEVEFATTWGNDLYGCLQRGDFPNVSAYTMPDIITPVVLKVSMCGEIAAARFFGVEYQKQIGRTESWDIDVDGWLIDVKSSFPPFQLLWPKSKNGIYLSKTFDLLMSVSVDSDDHSRCWVDGFTTKDAFYRHHLVAGDEIKLHPGTWYMSKRKLHVITGEGPLMRRIALNKRLDEIVRKMIAADVPRTGRLFRYCHCGKIGSRCDDGAWFCDHHRDMTGFVGYDGDGHLQHYCHCGKEASFGFGVRLLKGELGRWFCGEHRGEGNAKGSEESRAARGSTQGDARG